MGNTIETVSNLNTTNQLNSIEFEWGTDHVVDLLRTIRNKSLAARNQYDRPTMLPSRKALTEIVEGFCSAIFPHRLSHRRLQHSSVDYYVGQCLDASCRSLATQAEIEIQFNNASGAKPSCANPQRDAIEKVRRLVHQLPHVRELLDSDLEAAYQSDPAARSRDEVLACYPGFYAIMHHRIAFELYCHGLPLVARMISELAHSKTGIDIHPGAQIGSSFFIDHGTGVVIGETSVIGSHVRIHHGVTLGSNFMDEQALVRVEDVAVRPRHPIIEDDVTIFADATLLGRVRIGRGAVIYSNVCVTVDVPPYSKVTQAKSNFDSYTEGAGI